MEVNGQENMLKIGEKLAERNVEARSNENLFDM